MIRKPDGNSYRQRSRYRPSVSRQSTRVLRQCRDDSCRDGGKEVKPDDLIVAIGGRTGRDGIHGATFSSAELTSESEFSQVERSRSGTPSPKRGLDVLLQARDRGLFNAVTGLRAGGFSSAVGEMEEVGAEVWLKRLL